MTEARFTIAPMPRFFILAITKYDIIIVPFRFTRTTQSHFFSKSQSSGAERAVTPALFITISSRPKCFILGALKTQVQHFVGENVAWEKVTNN